MNDEEDLTAYGVLYLLTGFATLVTAFLSFAEFNAWMYDSFTQLNRAIILMIETVYLGLITMYLGKNHDHAVG